MRNQGFTLLEVSMVLVIMGFIAGAITVGSKLIRNAEINAISGEFEKHLAAIKAFQDKYQALPGDYSDADDIFSGAAAGDGDGLIEETEQFDAWQQLALAGMVEGTFTGADVAGGGSYDRVPGTNIPKSQASGAGWGLIYVVSSNGGISYQTGDMLPNHVLWFGGTSVTGASDNNLQNPILTGEEADLLDRKMDDGLPYVGKIVSQLNASGTACQTGSGPEVYNATATGRICSLVFKTGF